MYWKKSNSLENVDAGLAHSEKNAYTEYVDPKRDEWTTKILPALKQLPLRILVTGCLGRISRRALIDLRAARTRPQKRNIVLIAQALQRLNLF
jgi:hypothetical protein